MDVELEVNVRGQGIQVRESRRVQANLKHFRGRLEAIHPARKFTG